MGQEVKNSGLAIWSLVLGILGFFTCGITGIVGLILGIVGLSEISKSAGRLKGKGLAAAGIACSSVSFVVLFIGVMAAMLLPALNRAQEQARRAVCMANLKQIQTALIMYGGTWKDNYPVADNEAEALTILLQSRFVESPEVFACPSSDQIQATGPPSSTTLDSSNCSYAYSMNLSARSPWTCAVLGDRSEANHGDEGVNVAYNDGHVEWQQLDFEQPLSELATVFNSDDHIYARDEALPLDVDSWLRFRD
jgi:prepilin-type processing-associated H-X9-DG protein